MPPKAKDKKEEVADSDLPEIKSTICRLNMHTKDKNVQKFVTSIQKTQRLYYKIITRKDIIEYAKEKSLYLDPATMTDKQKKDPALADVPKELTEHVMANAFSLLLNEQDLVNRRAKKDFDDAVAGGADPKELIKQLQGTKDVGKKGGKDAKKPDPKGKGKVEEVVEEEEVKEDEYDKATDMIYLLPDYPSTKAEFGVLGRQRTAFNLLLNVNINYTEEALNYETVSQGSKVNRSNIDKSGDNETSKEQTDNEQVVDDILMDDDDKNFVDENKKLDQYLGESRSQSTATSGLRNACEKIINYTVNIRSLEGGYDAFKDVFFKFVCDFSLEIERYEKWCNQISTTQLVAVEGSLKDMISKSGEYEVDAVMEDDMKDVKSKSKKETLTKAAKTEEDADTVLQQKSIHEASLNKSAEMKARISRINYDDFAGLFEKTYKVAPEHTTGATI